MYLVFDVRFTSPYRHVGESTTIQFTDLNVPVTRKKRRYSPGIFVLKFLI